MMPNIARYALDSCRTIEENTQFLFKKAQEHKISTYGFVNLSNGNFLIRVDRLHDGRLYNIVIETRKY